MLFHTLVISIALLEKKLQRFQILNFFSKNYVSKILQTSAETAPFSQTDSRSQSIARKTPPEKDPPPLIFREAETFEDFLHTKSSG